MNGILKAFLGVTNANIQTLTDAQAIKANIMTNLKSMVADVYRPPIHVLKKKKNWVTL